MSRIGKLPISIPAGVTVAQDKDGVVTVKGPKGELSQKVDASIKMKIEDGHITFEIDENSPVNIKQKQAFHGLYRALVNNMVVGVSEGYKKEMELVGVGYTRPRRSSASFRRAGPGSAPYRWGCPRRCTV